MGNTQNIKRVSTEFEYPTYYYQYLLEVSIDSIHWNLFTDKTGNRRCGSPIMDDNNMSARYVRLTITGWGKTGLLPAVWNLKVYDSLFETPTFINDESTANPGVASTKSLLVNFNANKLKVGAKITKVSNKAKLGGQFEANGMLVVKRVDGIKAVCFDGDGYLKLSKQAPASLDWNASYTASVWVYNPTIEMGECLLAWNSRENMLQGTYAALMYGNGNFGAVAHGDGAMDLPYKEIPNKGKWHHIVVTFDGALENVYVDGKLNTQMPMSLYVEKGDILIGASGEPSENFSGYIANAQLYDKAMSEQEIITLMKATSPLK